MKHDPLSSDEAAAVQRRDRQHIEKAVELAMELRHEPFKSALERIRERQRKERAAYSTPGSDR